MFSIITCCLITGDYDIEINSPNYEKYFKEIVNTEDIIITDKHTFNKYNNEYKNSSAFSSTEGEARSTSENASGGRTILIVEDINLLDEIFKTAYKMVNKNQYIFVTGEPWLIIESLKRNDVECVYQSIIDVTDIEKEKITSSSSSKNTSVNTSGGQTSSAFSSTEGEARKIPIFQLREFIKESIFAYEISIFFRGNEIRSTSIEHVKWSKIVFNDFEQNYFSIIKDVIYHGYITQNRTDIQTISTWGQQLHIDLSQGFPLMTTKFVPFKGLVNEMLFFLSGKTDTTFGIDTTGLTKNQISNNVTKIWFDNTTREFLDKRGLTEYKQGEAGPIYGFQWRHYGAKYIPNKQLSIGEEGIDQIQYVINGIKAVKKDPSDPRGRRLLVCSWNPSDLDKMCLPPCHYNFQFSVRGDKLNCMVNMRSSDLFLGLPWNMNYALLVHMIAHITDMKPGKLVFNLADAHIYVNCIKQLHTQMKRNLRKLPRLEITRKHTSIDEFTGDSFKLVDYYPHPTLYADMAI